MMLILILILIYRLILILILVVDIDVEEMNTIDNTMKFYLYSIKCLLLLCVLCKIWLKIFEVSENGSEEFCFKFNLLTFIKTRFILCIL